MAKEIASETKTNKRQYFKTLDKIRMPIVMLNAILGDGLSFGRIINCYGKQQSGKSTFSLQTAQYFLEDYGDNCRVVIFDTEASFADSSRLENGFNLSPSNGEVEVINPDPRVLLHFTATIEDTFNMIIKFNGLVDILVVIAIIATVLYYHPIWNLSLAGNAIF